MAIKYRGSNGKRLTDSLFWENRFQNPEATIDNPYNMGREDTENSRSMFLEYMQYDTEYEAAIGILGDWQHWNMLCEKPFFQPLITEWRAEREEREKAAAKRVLLELAAEGNVNAAKTVFTGEGTGKKRGRPSTKEVKEEARRTAEVRDLVKRGMRVVGKDE